MISAIAFAVLAAPAAAPPLQGPESFVCTSRRFGYVGTISVYSTFADAKSRRNPRYTNIPVPQRDGAIYLVRNRPDFYEDFNAILSYWEFPGSPSNKNEGFFQMYDNNASNWQNQSAHWSKDLRTFTATAKGKDATYGDGDPKQYARLWNAGAPQGAGETTKGTYLEYSYTFVARTEAPATKGPDGFYEYTGTGATYSGTFSGIFRNESATSPASNGFYVVELQFNNNSWAKAQPVPPNFNFPPDRFGSNRVRN
jgi:hypothetical protein